jgi:hypothetical protein
MSCLNNKVVISTTRPKNHMGLKGRAADRLMQPYYPPSNLIYLKTHELFATRSNRQACKFTMSAIAVFLTGSAAFYFRFHLSDGQLTVLSGHLQTRLALRR